jgi:YhcH/YjgK/YiaL family protein
MIYDKLENLGTYCSPGESLYEAICYARDQAATQSDGNHPIGDDRLVAKVMSYTTEPVEGRIFECHRRHIDVQVMLSGSERHDVAPAQELKEAEPFDEAKDFGKFSAPPIYSTIYLEPGWFVVYYPQDNHRPNGSIGSSEPVRKVCMKIQI